MRNRGNSIRERCRRLFGACSVIEMGGAGNDPAYIELRGSKNEAICTIFPNAGNGGVGVKRAREIATILAGAFVASPTEAEAPTTKA